MANKKRKFAQCAHCKLTFAVGWKFSKHVSGCVSAPPLQDRALTSVGGISPNRRGAEADPGDGVLEPVDVCYDLQAHQSLLSEKGTIDDQFLVSYMNVPRRVLTAGELEVCDFLSSLDSGTGVSMATVQGSLDYVRRGGDRALLLPKSAKQCWNIVEKVMLLTHFIFINPLPRVH